MIIELLKNIVKLYLLDNNAFKFIHKKVSWQIPFFFTGLFMGITTTLLYLVIPGQITTMDTIILFITLTLQFLIGILSSSLGTFLLLKIVRGSGEFFETLKFYSSISIISFLGLIIIVPFSIVSIDTPRIIQIIIYILLLFIIAWTSITLIVTFAKLHKLSYLKTAFGIIVIPILLFSVAIGIVLLNSSF